MEYFKYGKLVRESGGDLVIHGRGVSERDYQDKISLTEAEFNLIQDIVTQEKVKTSFVIEPVPCLAALAISLASKENGDYTTFLLAESTPDTISRFDVDVSILDDPLDFEKTLDMLYIDDQDNTEIIKILTEIKTRFKNGTIVLIHDLHLLSQECVKKIESLLNGKLVNITEHLPGHLHYNTGMIKYVEAKKSTTTNTKRSTKTSRTPSTSGKSDNVQSTSQKYRSGRSDAGSDVSDDSSDT